MNSKKDKSTKSDNKDLYYVNPKEFADQIVEYYGNDENIPEVLGRAIYDIAHRLGFRPNYINYTFKEEMIGDAIIKMIQALKRKNFDPEKGNAFSYFNKIAWHAFMNRIKKENKSHESLMTYKEEIYNNYVDIGYIPKDTHEEQNDGDLND